MQLIEEKKELDDKLKKLVDFIRSEQCDESSMMAVQLLASQSVTMGAYSSILDLRIKLMNPGKEDDKQLNYTG